MGRFETKAIIADPVILDVIWLEMNHWTARTRTQVWGCKNAWSLAPPDGTTSLPTECEVVVEIQGDEKNGFHFVMSPDGFFTADTWIESIDEAFAD